MSCGPTSYIRRLLPNNAEETVLQGGVGFELTCELRRNRGHIRMMDTARAHTLMDSVNHHGAAARLERLFNSIRDLRRHGFLCL